MKKEIVNVCLITSLAIILSGCVTTDPCKKKDENGELVPLSQCLSSPVKKKATKYQKNGCPVNTTMVCESHSATRIRDNNNHFKKCACIEGTDLRRMLRNLYF